MSTVKVIKVNENVFAANDREADDIREMCKRNKTFFVNVMSAPGSGKTTMLVSLINMLKDKYNILEMDVDIDTDLDARRVAEETGIPSVQIHNGGLCHIDADMTSRALKNVNLAGVDLLILENIGNLVCPAEFDTGAHKKAMILSVPEGDDKLDTVDFFEFDFAAARERILALNPKAEIIEISAKTGEGMDKLAGWFVKQIEDIRE